MLNSVAQMPGPAPPEHGGDGDRGEEEDEGSPRPGDGLEQLPEPERRSHHHEGERIANDDELERLAQDESPRPRGARHGLPHARIPLGDGSIDEGVR